jgi:hypothetical protein
MTTSARAVTMGNASGPLKERGHDLYETPAVAVEALLRAETLPHHIWEPCCGNGALVDVLRAHGHEVTATDLLRDRIDFLMEWRAPSGADAIVSNPPYTLAAQFVRHGLVLVPKVVMLVRLNFYEAQTRADIFDDGSGLARIHVFANRLPRMHRAGWTGPHASPSMVLAWFVWQRGYARKTEIDRIWWRRDAEKDTL